MRSFLQRSLFAFFVLWPGGVVFAFHRVPVPPHVSVKTYGQAYYLLTDTSVQKLSLSGKALWTYTRNLQETHLFLAFDTLYVYGEQGISQIDGELGIKRWGRSFLEIIGMGHQYPYLVVHMPTETAYVHPETGLVMALSPRVGEVSARQSRAETNGFKGPRPLNPLRGGIPTANVLTDGKTVLEKVGALWQLKVGEKGDVCFQFDADQIPEIEAYLWRPPTLSVMTASHLVVWPYIMPVGEPGVRRESRR